LSKDELSTSDLVSMYRTMLLIRKFEEEVRDRFAEGEIPGFVHLYIGQEAIAAGVMTALRRSDYIVSTHRGHGHLIAKGADVRRLMAEIYGKVTGLNKGKGGSMHAADIKVGVVGANGIVGSGIGLAVGVGLAIKYRGEDSVVATFFGDGASNTGVFHESLNMASLWELPVIFVCENNNYAATTHVSKALSVKDVAARAKAYGIPGVVVDGTDVIEVFRVAKEMIERARGGGGPSLMEAKVMRVRGHFEGDPQHYRPKGEGEEWLRRNDPIVKLRNELLRRGLVSEDELRSVEEGVTREVREAVRFARESPYPRPEEALDDVYFIREDGGGNYLPPKDVERELTFVEAVREALDHEMSRNNDIIVMGEDVEAAGVWGVTKGLASKYGAGVRVIDTPISEDGFTLAAVGAAIAGLRVVVEHRFADFLYLACNAILNHAGKLRYMSGGQFNIPVVIRAAIGAGLSAAAQHSSTNVAMFTNHPGIKVVAPSTPYDAKGLFLSALRDGNPVMFFEHKKLYRVKGPVPEEDYEVPIGKADIKREGDDITIVTYSYMLYEVLKAAELLESKYGISAEVLDLRSIQPLDRELIGSSVRKTGKLLVVDEGWGPCGVSAEVINVAIEEALEYMDARPARLNTEFVPIPFSPPLEHYVLPTTEKIVSKAVKVVREGW